MDWRHRAACRDEDPELFFPIGNTGPALLQIEEAKAVCRRCAVVETAWLGAGVRPGRRRLGRPVRGRAPRAQAPHRPRPGPRRPEPHRQTTAPTPRRPRRHRRGSRRVVGVRPSRPVGSARRQVQRHLGAGVAVRQRAGVAAQLALDQGAHDLQARAAPTRSASKPGRQPDAVVGDLDPQPAGRSRARRRRPRRAPSRPSPSPCSTAFCTSSVSTIASGVATSARQHAERARRARAAPVRRAERADVGRPSPASRSAISSNVDVLVGRVRQRLVHERDRADPAHRLLERRRAASGTSIRRACSRSSAATVCRLFFTRWWISRIVASLVDQLALAAAQLGDVADEHQRADAHAAGLQRDRPQQHAPPPAPRPRPSAARAQPLTTATAPRRPGRAPARRSAVTSPRSAPTRSPAGPSRR